MAIDAVAARHDTVEQARSGPAEGARPPCETYSGSEPDHQCGRDAFATVWVQCGTDGPRERSVCRDHLQLLDQGVRFRCRHCASDLNLLHIGRIG